MKKLKDENLLKCRTFRLIDEDFIFTNNIAKLLNMDFSEFVRNAIYYYSEFELNEALKDIEIQKKNIATDIIKIKSKQIPIKKNEEIDINELFINTILKYQ